MSSPLNVRAAAEPQLQRVSRVGKGKYSHRDTEHTCRRGLTERDAGLTGHLDGELTESIRSVACRRHLRGLGAVFGQSAHWHPSTTTWQDGNHSF
ncbi:hypothetical protein AOLI_G00291030 [Acnodon oligacanthus]